jgi:hypothetical protein
MVKVITVIMNVIISARDYEGNGNERAVKIMAIQRMTPSSSEQLFPFVRLRRVKFSHPSNDDFQKRCHLIIMPVELTLIHIEKDGDDSCYILMIGTS